MKQNNYIEELLEQRKELVSEIKNTVFIAENEWEERVNRLETQVTAIDEIIKSLINNK